MSARAWSAMVVAGIALLAGRPARADGAFPTSQAVLLPRDRPNQIVVAATFGLVFTEDGGATWQYACEGPSTRMGFRYALGPAPADRIYGVSTAGLPVSEDGACSWVVGGGAAAGMQAFDVFPDPTDAERVFALAYPSAALDAPSAPFRSADGGRTYEGPLFTFGSPWGSTGIEISRAAPRWLYMTWYVAAGQQPRLSRSPDLGDTWETIDLAPALGDVTVSLAAVDPDDPRRLYLRAISNQGGEGSFDALAVSTDGGDHWSISLRAPRASMSGLVAPGGGRVWVVTSDTAETNLYRSNDGGENFTAAPLAFAPLGLAERDGVLYVPTGGAVITGPALMSSSDDGATWQERLRFPDITGVKECVKAECQADCEALSSTLGLFSPATCGLPVDGGGDGGGAGGRGGGEEGAGCGCTTAAGVGGGGALALVLLTIAMVAMRLRRDPRTLGATSS